MMTKNSVSALLATLLLTACAGSPMHTKSLSSTALMSVDDYTLCKAATPRELYSPNARIINEVSRRGLNCSAIYRYSGGNLEGALKALQSLSPQPNTLQTGGTAFLKREYTSGFNRICIYDRLGSEEAYNFKATDICPQTMR